MAFLNDIVIIFYFLTQRSLELRDKLQRDCNWIINTSELVILVAYHSLVFSQNHRKLLLNIK